MPTRTGGRAKRNSGRRKSDAVRARPSTHRSTSAALKKQKQKLELAETQLALQKVQLEKKSIALRKKAIDKTRAMLSTYRAAERTRVTADWRAPNVSADAAILGDASVLHARARQMVRDNPYAAAIVGAFRRNVVGTGMRPSADARNPMAPSEPLDVFNRMADEDFEQWAEDPDLVDAEGKRDFAAVQRWAIDELVTVGEALIIMSYDHRRHEGGGQCGFTLQLVETEQLDTTPQQYTDEHGVTREVRGGVEIDEFGKAVAYHILPRHPNDPLGIGVNTREFRRPDLRVPDQHDTRSPLERHRETSLSGTIRVPASRVIHIFDPQRVRQSRGVSRLTTVMNELRDLNTYKDAYLLKAKAEACIGVVIRTDPTHAQSLGMVDGDGNETDADGNDELAFQPIMAARVTDAEEVTPFTPVSTSSTFEPFVQAYLRAIAAGVGLSYEQLARDFTGGTYSSQRQGGIEDRREWEVLQTTLNRTLNRRVRNRWIFWRVMEGALPAPQFAEFSHLYYRGDWYGDGWEWVDPAKHGTGIEKMLDLGLTTEEREARKIGADWRRLQRQRAKELESKQSAVRSPQSAVEETQQPTTTGAGAGAGGAAA